MNEASANRLRAEVSKSHRFCLAEHGQSNTATAVEVYASPKDSAALVCVYPDIFRGTADDEICKPTTHQVEELPRVELPRVYREEAEFFVVNPGPAPVHSRAPQPSPEFQRSFGRRDAFS